MGYACPVCGTPQSDARHLANHLAFTALLGDDDHEDWLDEYAPDWEESNESALAERVREFADDAEYPQVFEDTTGHDGREDRERRSGALFDDDHGPGDRGHGSGGHDHGPGANGHADATGPPPAGDGLDAETERVLEEARDLTREMLGDAADGDEGGAENRDEEGDGNGMTTE